MVVVGGMCVRSITAISGYYFGKFIVTMVMLVMGGMCVQSITAIHTTIRYLQAAMLETWIFVDVTVYTETNHMSAENISPFSLDIANTMPYLALCKI